MLLREGGVSNFGDRRKQLRRIFRLHASSTDADFFYHCVGNALQSVSNAPDAGAAVHAVYL
jgi:hypothetical protein